MQSIEPYRRYGSYAVLWMTVGFVAAGIGLVLGTPVVRDAGLLLGALPGALGVIAVAFLRIVERR